MSNSDYVQNPLPSGDGTLPVLPTTGASSPQVCASVRLYLGILDDPSLSSEQVQAVKEHVQSCAGCAYIAQKVQQATQLVARLDSSTPSARVDQSIQAAIAARTSLGKNGRATITTDALWQRATPLALRSGNGGKHVTSSSVATTSPAHKRRKVLQWTGVGVAAAVLLFAMLGAFALHFRGNSSPNSPSAQAFWLPSNLTWSSYVLYHTETRIDGQGVRYTVNSYHDLGTGSIHVETMEDGHLDVVAVGDEHMMLGKDMLHHVAQWGADAWGVDDSLFDLAALRSDLQAKRATYLDIDQFRGQTVYRIRSGSGLVLLLSMEYMPVNVLRGAVGPGTGAPVYDTLLMMSAQTVPSNMWDMSIAGFQMGVLPTRP